jgi:hypothetical protein
LHGYLVGIETVCRIVKSRENSRVGVCHNMLDGKTLTVTERDGDRIKIQPTKMDGISNRKNVFGIGIVILHPGKENRAREEFGTMNENFIRFVPNLHDKI